MTDHHSVTSCATLLIPSLGTQKDVSLLDFFGVLMTHSPTGRSNGDRSISDNYLAYDPGGDRLSNMIKGTPACDEGDSTHAMKVTTHV